MTRQDRMDYYYEIDYAKGIKEAQRLKIGERNENERP